MTNRSLFIIAGLVVIAWLIAASTYAVSSGSEAVLVRMGHVTGVQQGEGLHWQLPFFEHAVFIDKRVRKTSGIEVSAPDKQGSQVKLRVAVVWKVDDPVRYYHVTANQASALMSHIDQDLGKALSNGKVSRSVQQWSIMTDAALAQILQPAFAKTSKHLGITIKGVVLQQVVLPQKYQKQILAAMQSETQSQAHQITAKAQSKANGIRTRADQARNEILQRARAKEAQLQTQTDIRLSKMYAAASAKDPTFFRFYHRMEADRRLLAQPGKVVVVISSESPLLKYLTPSASH